MASARSEDWEVITSGRVSPILVALESDVAPSGAPVPSTIPGTPLPLTPSQDLEALLGHPAPGDGEALQPFTAGAGSPTTPATEHPLELGSEPVVGSDSESDSGSDEEGGPMDGSTVLVPPRLSTGVWTRLKKHSTREESVVQQPLFHGSLAGVALERASSLAETVDSVSLATAVEERAATVAGLEQAAALSSASSGSQLRGPLTLLLLGKSGNGKSSTGNSILGRKAFDSKRSASPMTSASQMSSALVEGRHVSVIDTPGLLGDSLSEDAVLAELAAALQLGSGGKRGPVVLLLVLSAGCTFTAEEAGCLRRLVGALGPAALEHALLLFTHGDELEADDTPLYEYLRDSPRYLRELLKKVENRTALFNNRAAATEQVVALLATVDALLERTAGAPLPLAASLEAAISHGTVAQSPLGEHRGGCQASVKRHISENPKLRRGIYVALTACGFLSFRLLVGCGRSTDPLKMLAAGSALYAPGAAYGPCTWSLHSQSLLPASLPDAFANGSGVGAFEAMDDLSPLALLQ